MILSCTSRCLGQHLQKLAASVYRANGAEHLNGRCRRQPARPGNCKYIEHFPMSSPFTIHSKRKLLDGNEIPVLGFGTYESDGDEAYNAVKWALEAGYRHVDTAEWYENEAECGRAIRDFCESTKIPRSEIFYTTKLKTNIGYEATKKAIEASLAACGLGYIDLYLLHSPLGGPQIRKSCWAAVCDSHKEGRFKSVGVSNYGITHIQEMLDSNVTLPTLNQIDLHPFMTRTKLVALCQKHNIALEAWAPLVRGFPEVNDPSIKTLAKKYNKEWAQVLLRYSLQKGFIPLPKSTKKNRIISNAQLFDFELSAEEMAQLDGLDKSLLTDWDVTDCP